MVANVKTDGGFHVATCVKNWEIFNVFTMKSVFLNNCMSPHLNLLSLHVAIGDKGSISSTYVFMRSFCSCSSPKCKNSVKSSESFYAFGIYERKRCTKNVDEIEPRLDNTGLRDCYISRFCQFDYKSFFFLPDLIPTGSSSRRLILLLSV